MRGGGVLFCTRARSAVNPPNGAGRPVRSPENNHQEKRRHRSHEPPPECRVDNHAQRPVVSCPDYVTGAKTPLGVAVQEEKQIDRHSYDRKTDTPGFPRNESPFDIDDAPNPENLAGYEDENYGEVDQL